MWTVKRLRTNEYGIISRSLLSLQRKNFTSEKTERVMAIRREDINVWERRAPIAPSHVAELVHNGIKVLVQPSTRRAYTMDEYERAGAVITEDLAPASLIIGVKAVPIDLLIPNKTYAFFSHTIKAQEANMPLLDAMLEKVKSLLHIMPFVTTENCGLIDISNVISLFPCSDMNARDYRYALKS